MTINRTRKDNGGNESLTIEGGVKLDKEAGLEEGIDSSEDADLEKNRESQGRKKCIHV